jgi:hypothetical protein
MYDGAQATHAAYNQARALSAELEKATGADVAALKAKVDSLAPPQAGGRRGRGFGGGRGRGGAPQGPPTLEAASNAMIAAAMAMQNADVTPTASQIEACTRARATSADVLRRWTALKAEVNAVNTKRKAAGQPAISPSGF